MKKFLLMFCAAIISLAAHATLYVTGENVTGAPAQWNAENPLIVTETNGVYTFKAKGQFKISTAKGSWNDDFNPNAMCLDGDWTKATTTATASLKKGSSDITSPMDGTEITYEVSSDLSTIKATLPDGKTFGDKVEYSYALHGELFTGSWETKAMTENNGVWEWTGTVQAGKFGIKKLSGGSQAGWIAADGNASITAAGVYDAKDGGSDWSSTLVGEYTFSFNPETMKLTITAKGTVVPPDPDPTPTPAARYALHGQITGDPYWASSEMTAENGKFVWTGNISAGEFGIRAMDADGNQTGWISAPSADESSITAEGTYNTSTSGKANWSSTLEGNYTFTFDPAAQTLTITKYEGEITVVKSYGFKGTITGTEDWVSTEMTEGEDGTWSWTGNVVAGVFGVQYLENGIQKKWYASADETAKIDAPDDYNATENGTNWTLNLEGMITLKFNPTTLVLTVTGGSQSPAGTPEHVYIIGNFGENPWSTADPVEMTKEGDKFTAKATLKAASAETEDGYFSFITAKGADWDAVNGSDRYGAATIDEVMPTSKDVAYEKFAAGVNASAANSWKLKAGTYVFTIDFEKGVVRVEPDSSTGVENIETAGEAPAEYYNLQGVKVANPAKGVFIRVVNGKAVKVRK